MWSWQVVLSFLVAAWALQCAGTWIQIRRYRTAFRELSGGWSDGWMGAGKGGRFFQKGVIAMVVVAPDDSVRRVVSIAGRTVFARAERIERFEVLTVRELRSELARSPKAPLAVAVTAALNQIDTIRANQIARPTSLQPAPA